MPTSHFAASAFLQVCLRRRRLTHAEAVALRPRLLACDSDPERLRQRLLNDSTCDATGLATLLDLLPDPERNAAGSPYRRLALLGRGHFATTWLGCGPTGLLVIKDADASRLQGDAGDAILQELAGTGYRGVTNCLAVERQGDQLTWVVVYRQGRDLHQRHLRRLPQRPRSGERTALHLLRSAARGLVQLHADGRMHGDLHPRNLLLDAEGRVKLSDHGLSIDAVRQRPRPACSALELDRAAWAAPEESDAEARLGPTIDVYALACMGYWLLSGQPPFPGPPAKQILQHQHASRPDVRRLVPQISEATAKTLAKAMQRDPADRYASALQFMASLERNLAQLPVPESLGQAELNGP